MNRTIRVMMMVVALALGACGGGGADTEEPGDVFEDQGQLSEDGDSGDQESSAGAETGPVTQTADPSTGWVEVDGQRFELEAFGSINYTCELLEDRMNINFQQTTSRHDFTLSGSVVNGEWSGNLTFAPSGDTQVSYSASIGFDPGTLGIGEEAISYEGTVIRVEDFDLESTEEMQATLAVNCSAPDSGLPSADVGDVSFTLPLSGAGSLQCVVSDEGVEILISQSRPERRQLQIDIEDDGTELFGAAHVSTDEGTYTSFVPPDGTGLTIEGSSVTYEGTFTTPDGGEVEGSVSASCG